MANLTPDESEQLAIDLAAAKAMIETFGDGIPEVLKRVIQWAIKQGVQSPVESTLPRSILTARRTASAVRRQSTQTTN